jgi:hypothetical protein
MDCKRRLKAHDLHVIVPSLEIWLAPEMELVLARDLTNPSGRQMAVSDAARGCLRWLQLQPTTPS